MGRLVVPIGPAMAVITDKDRVTALVAQLCLVDDLNRILTSADLTQSVFNMAFTYVYTSDCVTDAALDLFLSHRMMPNDTLVEAIYTCLRVRLHGLAEHMMGASSQTVVISVLVRVIIGLRERAVNCVLNHVPMTVLCTIQCEPSMDTIRRYPNWEYVLDYIADHTDASGSALSVDSV